LEEYPYREKEKAGGVFSSGNDTPDSLVFDVLSQLMRKDYMRLYDRSEKRIERIAGVDIISGYPRRDA